ncbi:hypothetical protein Golax_010985 [Gossypium laxum]|uniref:Uncharacterized protein n=1 Tax=Gossypium laxum TaxID=34288 RepID=A0A7J8ZJ71_9ROSI|nr:hypothetical protein [Gossypium laxum]
MPRLQARFTTSDQEVQAL